MVCCNCLPSLPPYENIANNRRFSRVRWSVSPPTITACGSWFSMRCTRYPPSVIPISSHIRSLSSTRAEKIYICKHRSLLLFSFLLTVDDRVMEYCERGDLANYIYQTGRGGRTIPLARIWSIIDQISLALFRCHHGQNHPQDPAGRYVSPPGVVNIRVYHRDLKPANSKSISSSSFLVGVG